MGSQSVRDALGPAPGHWPTDGMSTASQNQTECCADWSFEGQY